MWSIIAIIGLLNGEVEREAVGRTFDTQAECAEHFSAHGTRVGMSVQGAMKRLKDGRQIVYIKIACERLS